MFDDVFGDGAAEDAHAGLCGAWCDVRHLGLRLCLSTRIIIIIITIIINITRAFGRDRAT